MCPSMALYFLKEEKKVELRESCARVNAEILVQLDQLRERLEIMDAASFQPTLTKLAAGAKFITGLNYTVHFVHNHIVYLYCILGIIYCVLRILYCKSRLPVTNQT